MEGQESAVARSKRGRVLLRTTPVPNAGSDGEDSDKDEDGATFRDMARRDKRRWDRADKDGDGHLDKEEFGNFLHPEESEDMKSVVVEETMEDIDKDRDGKISLDEYIGERLTSLRGHSFARLLQTPAPARFTLGPNTWPVYLSNTVRSSRIFFLDWFEPRVLLVPKCAVHSSKECCYRDF